MRLLVFLSLSLVGASVFASPVSLERAERVAEHWMLLQTGDTHVARRIEASHATTTGAEARDSHYYLFDMDPAGWVIVAADDVAYPILGYATDASTAGRSQPPSFVNWMRLVNASIADAARGAATRASPDAGSVHATAADIAWAWSDLERTDAQPIGASLDADARAEAVGPLMTTTWDQGRFYNAACPADRSSPYDGRALVGCCATALGQIMRYHAYPESGTGAKTYGHRRYGPLSADFGATLYDWAAMPQHGRLGAYNDAVATLLGHVGIAIEMNYGPTESACYISEIAPALREHFGYAAEDVAHRRSASDADWLAKIRADLDAGQPIWYVGSGSGGAHAFVLDGYTEADYFHFNWGWSGAYDGYFLLSNLRPGGISFTDSQYAVFGIRPAFAAPPDAPSDLVASPVSSAHIDLAWTDNSANERGFRIERQQDGEAWSEVGSTGPDLTRFSNRALAAETTYNYRVVAFSTAGSSDYSNTATATTPPAAMPPAAPTYLVATAVSSSRIDLSWQDNSTDEQGFHVQGSIGGDVWTHVTTLSADTTGYTHPDLTPNTTYTYRVVAFTVDGVLSDPSNAASATTLVDGGEPAAPTGLSATASSKVKITLRWSDRSNDEQGFRIERRMGDGAWAEIAQVRANVKVFANTALSPGTTYTYRVLAHNASGVSSYSNEASATTRGSAVTKPAAPSAPVARATSQTQIDLTWLDNSINEDGFRIERMIGAAAWMPIAEVAANSNSFVDMGLTPSTRYRYRVRAVNAGGTSAWATSAVAKTPR
jgi:fibronectin type 3 domain-containing protein